MKATFLFSFVALLFLGVGCKKEIENFEVPTLSTDYLPLEVGKYITYRLDSTVFTQQGRNTEIHSYQEKQEIADQMLDNSGRQSFIIQRSLRDVEGLQSWTPAGSYYITLDSNLVEVVENNLRFVKLVLPLITNYNWKGNRYLPNNPYHPQFSFDLGNQLSLWDYHYEEMNGTLELNGRTFQDVLTMKAAEDSIPITEEQVYAYKTVSIDKYAKNIGLIYQQYAIWEYQKNIGSTPYKTGFEVERSIIDHN